jgi:hypothetical protein
MKKICFIIILFAHSTYGMKRERLFEEKNNINTQYPAWYIDDNLPWHSRKSDLAPLITETNKRKIDVLLAIWGQFRRQ